MLVIFTVVILIAAAIIIFVRRQTRTPLLDDQTPKYLNGESLRPLFAPDEEELRALELAEEESAKEQAAEQAREAYEKRLASFEEFRQTWRELPSRANTVELLFRASELERGEVYLDTIDELLHKRSDVFTNDEIAQLIESHFWLLPQRERTPGVTFTINRELAALRGRAQTISDEEASDA
jgi:DNA repair ATPase RecN